MIRFRPLLGAVALALVLTACEDSADEQTHSHQTPYAGFETRAIKSLSADNVADLERDGGWGLALPTELNGKPGPAHLLELAEPLDLTAEQVTAIEALRDAMRAEAIEAGARFIAAEAALSAAFEGDAPSPETLTALLAEAAEARAALRYVHLSRHLDTPALLTEAQIAQYITLRGYGADPCVSVPDGHNATLWRLHNGCS